MAFHQTKQHLTPNLVLPFLCSLGLMGLGNPLFARESDSNGVQILPQTTVTATKSVTQADFSADHIHTVDSAQIRQSGATNVIELLSMIPGVDVDPDRTRTNLKLNGLGGDYVKLLVDGIPVTGDVGGGYPLENLVLGDLERMEIMSGSSSTLYGSDAIGGVVHLITRKHRQPTTLGMNAELRHVANDSLQWSGKNQLNLNLFHVNALFKACVFGGLDYDQGLSTTKDVEGETYKRYSYSKDYRYKLGTRFNIHPGQSWSLTPSFQTTQSASDYSSSTSLIHVQTVSRDFNLGADWEAFSWLNFSGYGSIRSLNHDHKNTVQIGFPSTELSETDFNDKEGELRSRLTHPILGASFSEIMFGANYINESVESDNLRNGVTRDQMALFSNAIWVSHTAIQWVLSPSIRATITDHEPSGDHWEVDDISPKMGLRLNHLFWHPLSISLNYGEAFKNPTLKKMYYSFNMGNSIWIEGNENLKPENSKTLSATLQIQKKSNLNLTIHGYYTSLDQMVVLANVLDSEGNQIMRGRHGEADNSLSDYSGALIPEKTYVNADHGKTYGWTASLEQKISPWISLRLSYAHIESKAETTDGIMQNVAEVCPHVIQASTTLLPMLERWWWPEATLLIQWNDRTIDSWNSDTASYHSAFTRINLGLTQNFSRGFSVNAGVNNILNHVRQGHLALDYGRNYYLSIRWNQPKLF